MIELAIPIIHPIDLTSRKNWIFLDLDGVFADFEKKFFEITGKYPKQFLLTEKKSTFWKIVNNQKDFFYSLDQISGSEELFEVAKPHEPVFLTGAPTHPSFQVQKRNWVINKFGDQYTTIVLPKREKKLYSGPSKILIDDTESNIESWIEAGGIGILHSGDFDKTISTLKRHLK